MFLSLVIANIFDNFNNRLFILQTFIIGFECYILSHYFNIILILLYYNCFIVIK